MIHPLLLHRFPLHPFPPSALLRRLFPLAPAAIGLRILFDQLARPLQLRAQRRLPPERIHARLRPNLGAVVRHQIHLYQA